MIHTTLAIASFFAAGVFLIAALVYAVTGGAWVEALAVAVILSAVGVVGVAFRRRERASLGRALDAYVRRHG